MIRRKLTPFGVEVKKRLLDLGVSQSAFCRRHGIPENRFSESLYGANQNSKYRDKIARILDIRQTAPAAEPAARQRQRE